MSENTATKQTFTGLQPGEFCWTEIATTDAAACQKFYQNVFGWKFKKSDATGAEMQYLEFGTSVESPFGGMFQMNPAWYDGEMPKPHANIYVAVDDVDAAAKRTVELGGKIVGEPMDVENVGRMSEIQDPTGARIFIIKLKN